MDNLSTHVKPLARDKLAAIGVCDDLDRQGIGQRVIDSFADLREFPQRVRHARILRAPHIGFERGNLLPRCGNRTHSPPPVKFFGGHASLV
jgi:hypothetical protein